MKCVFLFVLLVKVLKHHEDAARDVDQLQSGEHDREHLLGHVRVADVEVLREHSSCLNDA